MASVINTNVASLNAQRNLATSQTSLATSIQRLSSGLRINSAKDDAAGLAISERFNAQIRGLNQASRNANDGISLTQTAEGAMVEISNNLQRVRELAVQSANATNSTTDRAAMQAEVTELVAEIDRVASQTNFNGTKLLDGSFSGQQIQIGADAGQTIAINSILNASSSKLGTTTVQTATVDKVAATATGTGTANGYADYAEKTLNVGGVDVKVGVMTGSANTYTTDALAKAAGEKAYGAHMAAAINATFDQHGLMATSDDLGVVTLTKMSGDDKVAIGGTSIKTASATTVTKNVKDLSIATADGAQLAMKIADKALEAVNSARANMGAAQNRFSSVISNLSTSIENQSASRSRILDADYASETASLTRSQILQQAGTAMLAQANSLPQSVLRLLN